MVKKLLPLSVFLVTGICGFAQTYTMSNAGSGNAQYATTCSGTFYDNGGALANYSNGVDASYTFFPAVATQYTRLTFTSFDTQAATDIIYVYDGPGGPLINSYSGTPGVFSVTASASNATHGLTVRFHANGSTNRPGWVATVSCTAVAGAAPAFTPSTQDCEQGGATTVCSNSTFSGNSNGNGTVNDLAAPWDGCLSGGENQSSWYYFSPSASGTVGFTISPNNGTDDYDFALWGPFTTVSCPLNLSIQPLRCSWAAGGGNTGCGNGAVDVSEGAGGDRWVSTFNVLVGEVYVLVIDNYSSSTSPFTLNWSLSGGASLNCSVLPVEFISFTGHREQNYHKLEWVTGSENNNDYFTVERSTDGLPFTAIGRVDGAGTSTQLNYYSFNDLSPKEGANYYRIRQVDFNGQSTISNIVVLNYHATTESAENLHPVPTNGEVNFDFLSPEESDIRIVITDVAGRVVTDEQRHMTAGRNTINTSIGEAAGMYLLHVTDAATGFSWTQRIVKY